MVQEESSPSSGSGDEDEMVFRALIVLFSYGYSIEIYKIIEIILYYIIIFTENG